MTCIPNDAANNDTARWDILALLRFVLAMIVVLGHFANYVKPDPFNMFGDAYWHPLGAVYGFLILSGYSIAASLNQERANSNVYFYIRRFVRIWPLYLVCVAYGFFIDKSLSSGVHWPQGQYWKPSTDKEVLGSILMLQTFCLGPIPVIGPVWSLAVEWWFYMVAPFFKRHFCILLCLSVISLSYFIVGHHRILHAWEVEEWTPSFSGKFSLAMGWFWITGYIYYHWQKTSYGMALLVAPGVLAALVGRSPGMAYFLTVLVLIASSKFNFSTRYARLKNFLGDLSYPLYLFHVPTMALLIALGFDNFWVIITTILVLSTTLLYLVDYPARHRFKRLGIPPASN